MDAKLKKGFHQQVNMALYVGIPHAPSDCWTMTRMEINNYRGLPLMRYVELNTVQLHF